MSNAHLLVEAVDTAIRLGWALIGWLVFFATVASILTLAAIACGATVIRGVWRHTAGPSWRRSSLRARIHAPPPQAPQRAHRAPPGRHRALRLRGSRMIRETKFLISRKPFAIDLSTVVGRQGGGLDRLTFSGTANALWFRRQSGVTRACLGTLKLWSHYLPEPLDLDDPVAILSADLDGRYGGGCEGRWDGERYWGAQEPDVIEEHLALLRPMLNHYPKVPPGHDGWWTFQEPR